MIMHEPSGATQWPLASGLVRLAGIQSLRHELSRIAASHKLQLDLACDALSYGMLWQRLLHRLIRQEKSPMPSSPPPAAPADAPLSLGIDIGGTFTDIVVIDPSNGNAVIWKESTTPDDPARGTMLGLWKLVKRSGIALERIGRVIHATTLFTNALIERKGAPTGLITTAGFADVLEIGRERKYELYDIFLEMPPPLVPRPWRREVPERLAPDGTVEIPLDVTAVLREVEGLVAEGVRSLAVCFLHAMRIQPMSAPQPLRSRSIFRTYHCLCPAISRRRSGNILAW